MTSSEIRNSFLKFFEKRGHRIVPSSSVIPDGDPTLLFTNAGMNQFKDVFLGTGKRDYVRAVDTQKCIRVSGKHNDLEEVGRDTYHHTFFEMLGNWSFGDYYKKEAIAWAWELLTDEWGLEKKRLYATVYQEDEEAEELWKKVTDIHPSHVLRFGKKDNFWEMGETGPCGPCSEIHIDLTSNLSGAALVNAGDPRVMEIWNLVFIQNNRNEKGELELLPARHVDTGMGFERVCAVLQGKSSNYDTDVFMPIIDEIARLVGREYTGTLDAQADIGMRVIADHIRMLTFAIADGAIPGNEGRGYVLRRILRRAARFGRNLGMHQPFIYKITAAVIDSMGKAFPELVEKRTHVEKVIHAEEEGFNTTLDRGLQIFESIVERIGHSKVFPGEDAFKLYDTYGFPLDLTQMMAEERGLKIEVGEFNALMKEQQHRSRESGKAVPQILLFMNKDHQSLPNSEFRGYNQLETISTIVSIAEGFVLLDKTPFYAESGGQVGDTGVLTGKVGSSERTVRILDTKRDGKLIAHRVEDEIGELFATPVLARVDSSRRINIQRNHSATHLVHEALRRVLGSHVHQQGSLVAADHLRFDFPHFGKISSEEIKAIEEMVNQKIRDNISVMALNDPKDWVTIEEAKRRYPNVKMYFGEKYGERVRIVEIDPAFSVELCGGTHVRNTRDIELFKIISESSIASGVRRIEAVTGEGIQRYIDEQRKKVVQFDDQLTRLIEEKEMLERELARYTAKPAASLRPKLEAVPLLSSPAESIEVLEATLAERELTVEQASKEMQDLRKELSKHKVKEAGQEIDGLVGKAHALNGFKIVSSRVDASTMDELKNIGDTLRTKLGSGVGILASVIDEKVALVCVVTEDLIKTRNLQAGKIVGEIARQVGGGGGGKPHLATAGGKEVSKLDDALARTVDIIRSML